MPSAKKTKKPAPTAQRASHTQTEVERKYDVGADTALPDLVGAGPVAGSVSETPVELRAEYFDTSGRALSRGRITLRRRAGGADEGWHVKLPGSAGRTEIHAPLTESSAVPTVIRSAVLGHVGRSRLEPLALLETRRGITRVLDAAGRQLAEVADDLVVAVDARTGVERRWREWEVELVDASGQEGEAVLDAIEERLLAGGARPAESASKLARATGGPIDDRRPAPRDGGEAALAAIAVLLRELRAVDPFVRLEGENALHRMRTLSRRLRSVLAASRSVLDRTATDPIRDELRWLGSVLGAARDEEVLGARLRTDLDAAAEQLPAAAVAPGTILEEVERRHGVAVRRVARTLRGGRYLDLLASLDELLGDPPRLPKAASSPKKLVKRSLKKELSRLETARSGPDRHEVRKAAKRLRYVVEAWRSVVPSAVGSTIHRLGSAAEDIADSLGEQRDALAARRALGEHAARATRLGEPAAALGVAFAEEGHRAHDAGQAAEEAFARFDSLSR